MPARAVDKDLALRLETLRRDLGDTVRIDQIADVVRAMLTGLSGDINAADLKLYHELESLAIYIHKARAEIASLRPREIQDRYIATATDELDAIVDATEVATNTILDATEQIEAVMAEMPADLAERLGNVTTQIYEACNFQDITGQRITKVVRTLKEIESKVEALVAAFGPAIRTEEDHERMTAESEPRPLTDEELLNGPQLPHAASRQDEIDKLLASFD
jgi:chemotaxis protein CheZ